MSGRRIPWTPSETSHFLTFVEWSARWPEAAKRIQAALMREGRNEQKSIEDSGTTWLAEFEGVAAVYPEAIEFLEAEFLEQRRKGG